MTPKLPKPFKRPEVVEVEWLDSMGYSGWNGHRERTEYMDHVEDMQHVTAGYLLKRAKTYIAVMLSMGYAGQVGDTIQIPRSAVKRITVLRKATDS